MGQQIVMSTFSWMGPCLGSSRGHRLKVKSAPDPTRRLMEPFLQRTSKVKWEKKKKNVFYWVSPINNLPQRGKKLSKRGVGQRVIGGRQSKLLSWLPTWIMALVSIKAHHLGGCRAVEGHVFSGLHLQGWIPFKYLCKCVSELKRDLVPTSWTGLVPCFSPKGRDPEPQDKG